MKRTFFLFLLLLSREIEAGFFEKHEEGWHWYAQKDKKEENEKNKHRQTSPTEWIEHQQKILKESLYLALFEPSFENIKSYQILQKEMMDRSQNFSEMWQRVLFSTPKLDENTVFPTTQIGRHTYLNVQQKKKKEIIQKIAKSYGLFFFFKGDCSYCHVFAPIVKQFALKHRLEIMAISLDGGIVDGFRPIVRNNGAAEKLDVKAVPALIAVNPLTKKVLPINYGVNSLEDLENRFLLLEKE